MSEVYRFAHEAMATTFELLVADQPLDYARNAAYEAFREIDRLESRLSRFRMDSDVALANRLNPGETVRVGIECFEVLQLAGRVFDQTNGAFDVTFRRGPEAGTAMPRLALLCEDGGFEVGLLPPPAAPQDQSAADPGLCLDLGGIGKGYALDSVKELLLSLDIEHALIHSGTSTALAWGQMPGHDGWPVGTGGLWATEGSYEGVYLENQALSGSGTEVKGEHLVDPRSGQPPVSHQAAWVIAPNAADADALSTAFFIMTTDHVIEYCTQNPGTGALLVTANDPPQLLPIGNWPVNLGGSRP